MSGTLRSWSHHQKTPTSQDATRGLHSRMGGLGRSKAHKQNQISKSEPKINLRDPRANLRWSAACTDPLSLSGGLIDTKVAGSLKQGEHPTTLPTALSRCAKESGQRYQGWSYSLGNQVATFIK